jgi:hypothetical protein
MMIIYCSELQQDTVPRKIVLNQDSLRKNTDSASLIISVPQKDSIKHRIVKTHQNILPDYSDTTSVCTRNSITDVTYWDSNNVILKIEPGSYTQFPYSFTEKIIQKKMEDRAFLMKQLKTGDDLPVNPFHADWIIIIIIAAAFLYSLVKTTSKGLIPDFGKFFLFRGINDPASRDIGGLFHWQSTLLNLSSFFIIGLFGYLTASYYNFIPAGFKGIIIWLIALLVVSVAVTLRHFACILTGIVSEEEEVFRQYLLGIYQAYRFGALFLFVIIILMSYTVILPVVDFIISGIFIIGLVYLVRIIRLLIIFLNRNISIFYLILYLCALEILPVLIVVKYFTGLV